MKIEKIKRLNVAQTVFEQMRQMIFEGEWTVGQRIPSENELAKRFGVSRASVRQAIQNLGTLGLVYTKVGEGTFVSEQSIGSYMNQITPALCLGEDNVRQVMQYRLIVEPECAALAAKNASPGDIVELEKCYNEMIRSGNNIDAATEYDFAFHAKLVEISDNSILLQIQLLLQEVLKRTINELTSEFTNDYGVKYHKLVLESVRNHDVERAREYMRKHMQEMLDKYNDLNK